jgi:hypothetical protein
LEDTRLGASWERKQINSYAVISHVRPEEKCTVSWSQAVAKNWISVLNLSLII